MEEKIIGETVNIVIGLIAFIWGIICIVFCRAFGRAAANVNEKLHLPRNDMFSQIFFAIGGLALIIFGLLALLGIIK